MQPEKDIYIYYDAADNSHFEGQDYGWVDNFERFLKMMLRQIMGGEPSFLSISPEKQPTEEQLKGAKVMIMLVSANSVKSSKLSKTYQHFIDSREKQGKGENIMNPVFKVIKYPVAPEKQPEEIRRLIAYDLYDYNASTGTVKEFENFFSPEAEVNFWMKMVDLAYDINEQLQLYNKQDVSKHQDERKAIFLAEAEPALVVQRNMIKRELQRQGYVIYPKVNLPSDTAALKQQVDEILNKCFVSIHLFGDRIDQADADKTHASVTIQNEIVSKYIESNSGKELRNFSRLIWLSPNFKVTDEKQQGFLEKLRREVEDTGRTEIFQTPYEDFKFILKKTLSEIPDRITIEQSEGSDTKGNKKIYIIYDKSDSKHVADLEGIISKKGYDILKPSFDGDLMDIRQMHIQNLVDFDGVIIYSQEVNEFWVKMKLLDILKSPGFGRLKSLKNKAIISSGGEKLNKETFKNFEIELIESDRIDDQIVEPFLSKIN